MTNGKMIRILSSYEDKALFEIKDTSKYDFEKDKYTFPVREVVLLSEIIEEFKNKSGFFFDEFHFTASFRDLIKLIESGKSDTRYRKYEDSEEERKKKWSEYHPNETEEQFLRRKREETHRAYKQAWNEVTKTYMLPWQDSIQDVYYLHNHRRGW